MPKQFIRLFSVLVLCVSQIFTVQGQYKNIDEMNMALENNKIEKADSLLQSTTEFFIAAQQPDSLVNYIYQLGRINYARLGRNGIEAEIELIIEKIKKLTSNPATIRQAYLEAGEFYGSLGLNMLAYQADEEALKFTLAMPDRTGVELGIIENNLAAFAQRMGDLNLAQAHSRKALIHNLKDSVPNYEILYATYNGLGSAMWYASKPDSALYYYNLALQTLEKTPRNPTNQYYRPAIILNNLSGLYHLQGQSSKAIAALKMTISNLNHFENSDAPINKKNSAISFRFEAIDNLAGMYKEFGDMQKARELLEFSYQQKQKKLTPDDPAIFISKILLGQLFYATRDYDKAILFLNEALKQISITGTSYSFWEADACHTLAMLYDAEKQVKLAKHFYEKADSLYEESLQGEYDNIYLGFLSNSALFYAEQGDPKTAISKAQKGYNYVVETQGLNTLLAFEQLLNLSEVYYLTGDYSKSLSYSEKGLEVLRAALQGGNNLLDSVRMELKKPKAVLLKARAEYQIVPQKDSIHLTPLYNELNTALTILERRKSVLTDAEDIERVISEHSDLVDFAKKINFELYKLTGNKKYIDRVMELHESGLYNRIRSRLDKNDSLRFAHIPIQNQALEKQLKLAVSDALNSERLQEEKISDYFKAVEEWNNFLEQLRAEFPDYYAMRYSSIFKNMEHIQQSIPENTSLIRYFFIDKELFALVADNSMRQIFSIETDSLEVNISSLSEQGFEVGKTSVALYDLYQQLWMPLSKSIRHNRVIIIPDGVLFNLNFEILTPRKISSFNELVTKSLLADYTFSYQYSLLLLNRENNSSGIIDNFVAFAPGFLDAQKESYGSSRKDSMEMDKGYFYLLPQPFSIELATKMKKTFGGKAFLLNQSTEASFKANAGNHKIIHIGTHAESNNDYPEFSRLIFAKNTSDNDEDNSLFVDEIYNCDLRSNLATLTACETGKPGYQEGEGMISLAHAFNYAGSESILTGLWKIDEQASSQLLEDFYNNLVNGLPKDEALRQAKLSYLQNSNGRMLAPQYWAGLVIIGDVSPIQLKQKTSFWFLAFIGVILLFAGSYFVLRRNRRLRN